MSEIQEPVRKNIRIPKELSDWLDKESRRTAIPVSSLITIGVEQYRQTKEGLGNMGEWVSVLNELSKKMEVEQRASE